ncbi:MFS transporter [Sphingomonas sp. RT2P30]|uniref:MFS transporter n=1 Tax=Parasphingomonas halimpatiens TaxID=3096162 RepID=UPI002FC95E37
MWRVTLVYGFAHLGKSLFWYSSEILFAFFLTEIAGLPAQEMGIVLATGFLVSAGIDLGMGYGLQRWLATAAAASRLQFVGSVLCSVAGLAVFFGASLPAPLRFGYAMVAGIGFRFAFAAYDIPQNALMALGTTDPASRLRVASTRIWFSGAATLIVAATVGPLVAMHDGPGGIRFLLGLTALFALVAIGSAGMLARVLRDRTAPDARRAQASRATTRASLPPALWLLLVVMVATSAFTPAFSKLEPYFASYTLQSAWWGGAVMLAAAAGILLGQPIWLRLCHVMRRATVMLGAALLQIVALTGFALTAQSPLLAVVAALVFGLGNGGVGMVQWAVFSETVSGMAVSRAGPSYGLFAASGKIGFAAGGMLLAALLSRTDFRGAGNVDLPLMMCAIPTLGAVLVLGAAIGLRRLERGMTDARSPGRTVAR